MEKQKSNRLFLKKDKSLVNKALAAIFRSLKGPAELKEAMKYSVMNGGKRLRPAMVIESAKALGGGVKEAMPFACAMELVHSFSLVHDDLPSMDDDDTRRGKPACHRRFGEAIAILAGDALLNLSFGTVLASGHKNALRILARLSEAIGTKGMTGGQALDIKMKNLKFKMKNSTDRINRMKTASIMAVACGIGALSADAGPGRVKMMEDFGMSVGLAFQIADDMEDYADRREVPEEMGKRVARFIDKAKKSIRPLGKKASALINIADIILEKGCG